MQELGYSGEVGYDTFLYPNELDTRSLVMWLVDRLPRVPGPHGGATDTNVLS